MKTIKRIGRRLGALLLVLCLAVSVFPAATLAASSYSSTKAISYAKSHWNDGQGLCAEFVSNCLKSGGCSAWSVNCGQLLTQLKNGGYGAVYQLKVNSDGRISQSANSGKVSAGDPIFCYCSKESSVYRYTHVYLCSGSSSAGYLTGYAHNNAKNGSTIYASTCGYCGGKLTAVYAFHMNGSGGTAASSTKASTLAIRPTAYPTGSLTQGSYYSLKGTVSSNYKITSVKGEIINSSGKAVCSYTQKPNNTSFSIYNSTLDSKMTFNTLSPGTYYLKYTAADASGKTATWKSGSFTVKAKTSTLSIKPTAYPTGTLTQGSYYSLKGAVSSNYKITSVKGEIINSSGKAVCSYTQKPNSTSFSIYNSTLDKKMTFNTLSPGTYYLKYTAADASGKTVTWKSGNFTVKPKQASASKTATSASTTSSTKLSPSTIRTQITNTYNDALKASGRSTFNGWCGEYVQRQLHSLGIINISKDADCRGNGNQWYGNVKSGKTSTGYTKAKLSGGANCLANIVKIYGNNITNIVISYPYQYGCSYKDPGAGHVVFIHAIVDGTVYYSECYPTNGIPEGHVLTSTVSAFDSAYTRSYGNAKGAIYFHK